MKRRSAIKPIALASATSTSLLEFTISQHLIVKRQCGIEQNLQSYWE